MTKKPTPHHAPDIGLPDLGWEHGIGGAPDEIWRVTAIRPFDDREIRHVNSFVTEAVARAHAKWIESRGGRVLSVVGYRRMD